jgi:hypothetical protein
MGLRSKEENSEVLDLDISLCGAGKLDTSGRTYILGKI